MDGRGKKTDKHGMRTMTGNTYTARSTSIKTYIQRNTWDAFFHGQDLIPALQWYFDALIIAGFVVTSRTYRLNL